MRAGTTVSVWRLSVMLSVLCLLAGGRAAAAAEPLADLVPADAVAHLSVPDVPGLLAKLRAAPPAGLLREPAFREAMGQDLDRLRAMEAGAATFLGSPDGSLERVFTGPLSVSVLPSADGELRVLVLAAVAERAEQIRAMLDGLAALAEGRAGDGPLIRAEYEHHTIYVLREMGAVPVEEGGGSGMRLCLAGDVLAVALSPGDGLMRSYLELLDAGGAPPLGSRPDYLAALHATGPEADVHFFVDLGALGVLLSTGMAEGLDGALGLADRNVAALAIRMTDDGIGAEGFVSAPGPRHGLLKALSSAASDLRPPEFVTADAAFFAGLSFDLSVLWHDAFEALESTDPDAVATIRQALRALPVNIERDIVGALGHEWFLVGSSPDGGWPGVALCVELERARSFRRAWGAIIDAYPPLADPVVTEVDGALIYKLTIGHRRAGDAVGPERCLVLAGDRLVLATSMDLAKAIAAGRMGAGGLLRDEDAFRDLSARTGAAPSVVLYSTGRPTWRAAAQAADLAEGGVDVIEEYASPALLAGSWTEDGLHVHGFMPYPSSLPADTAQP